MFDAFFFGIFFAVIAWALFAFFTKRGKEFMFGGKIIKTFDEVKSRGKMIRSKLRVHVIDDDSTRIVGIQVYISSFGKHELVPITLTTDDARQLAQTLIEAADYREDS